MKKIDKISRYSLIVLILLFPFGQLTKIPLFNGAGSIYLHDILIILLLILYGKDVIKLLPKISKHKYLIAFIALSALSLILATSFLGFLELLISSFYLWRFLAYILFFYILAQKKVALNLQFYIYASIVLTLLLGFIQYFYFPSLESIFAANWDRHLNRLAGSWLDTGFTGIILSLQFLYLLNLGKLENNSKYLRYLLLVLTFVAVLLTYSRSSFIALLLGSIVLASSKKMTKIIIPIFIFFIIGLLLLPQTFGEGTKLGRISTINSRLGSWQQGLELFIKKPILGYGFNTIRYVKKDIGWENSKWELSHSASGFENAPITLLVTSGILGAVFYCIWIVKFIVKNNNPLFLSSFATIFLHGIFANTWFYPWIILWMGIIYLTKNLKN